MIKILPSEIELICPRGEIGLHYMLIYQRIETLRQIYCGLAKSVLENSGVLLVLPYFESPADVYYYLKEAGIDTEYHRRSGSLFVVDSVQQFFNSSAQDVMRFIELLNKRALRNGKNGVTTIIDMDALFHFNLEDEFGRFESQAGPIGNSSKFHCLVCAYHKSRIERLDNKMQAFLGQCHKASIAEDETRVS